MLEVAFFQWSAPFASVPLSVLLQIRTGEEQGAVLLLDYLMQN